MTSRRLALSARPAHRSVPMAPTSAGLEAVELAASAGLTLDPWQAEILDGALGERPDGKWAAFEVGLIVPRQNGKGSILEARELAGLFLFGERLILHSAHEFKTAKEAYQRVRGLIEQTPDLDRLVNQYRYSNEEVSIELVDRRKLRFIARSTGSGRGFTGDVVILDEAYHLSSEAMAALLPTLSARPNPQIWYTSSAPLVSSEVLRKLCKRGRAGDSKKLAYFEFCAEADQASDDPEAWMAANPALGVLRDNGTGINAEFIADEMEALDEPEFRRERLGIWFDEEHEAVIDAAVWKRLADPSKIVGRPALAIDVSPDRRWASICSAGRRADREFQVAIADRRAGTRWVVDALRELIEKVNPVAVVLDPAGPAGRFVADLEEARIEFRAVSSREVGQACGLFYDSTMGDDVRVHHFDDPDLNSAVAAGRQRPLGDAWAWARKSTSEDISPLVAATLALWSVRESVDVSAQVW